MKKFFSGWFKNHSKILIALSAVLLISSIKMIGIFGSILIISTIIALIAYLATRKKEILIFVIVFWGASIAIYTIAPLFPEFGLIIAACIIIVAIVLTLATIIAFDAFLKWLHK